MKVAFIDRDGTINKDYPDEDWIDIVEPELLEGSIQGLQDLIGLGYQLIMITNQYIIGEGIITLEQYQSFNNQLFKILNENNVKFLDVFFCPHARNSNCGCCKPDIGLITQALCKYPEINLSECIFIGDSKSDEGIAMNVGIPFYGIQYDCVNRIENLSEIKNKLGEII